MRLLGLVKIDPGLRYVEVRSDTNATQREPAAAWPAFRLESSREKRPWLYRVSRAHGSATVQIPVAEVSAEPEKPPR